MHLIKDENENLLSHGHSHADNVNHSHEHSHEGHESDCGNKNKTLVLMKYMLDHNVHHADELAQMAESMDEHAIVAEAIKDAVAEFRKANEKLGLAVKKMQEEINE